MIDQRLTNFKGVEPKLQTYSFVVESPIESDSSASYDEHLIAEEDPLTAEKLSNLPFSAPKI